MEKYIFISENSKHMNKNAFALRAINFSLYAVCKPQNCYHIYVRSYSATVISYINEICRGRSISPL